MKFDRDVPFDGAVVIAGSGVVQDFEGVDLDVDLGQVESVESKPDAGIIFVHFLGVFRQLLHATTMSQTITDIPGSSRIFQVSEVASF